MPQVAMAQLSLCLTHEVHRDPKLHRMSNQKCHLSKHKTAFYSSISISVHAFILHESIESSRADPRLGVDCPESVTPEPPDKLSLSCHPHMKELV